LAGAVGRIELLEEMVAMGVGGEEAMEAMGWMEGAELVLVMQAAGGTGAGLVGAEEAWRSKVREGEEAWIERVATEISLGL